MKYLFKINCTSSGSSLMNVFVTRCSDDKKYVLDYRVPAKCYDCVDVTYYSQDVLEKLNELFNDMKEHDKNGTLRLSQVDYTLKRVAIMVRGGYRSYSNVALFVNDEGDYQAINIDDY